MDNIFSFLMEMDRLKSVYRRAYIHDLSRNENSAEHSWHLAIAVLALKDKFGGGVDIYRTIKMALVHDICEIGAGDKSIYDVERAGQEEKERIYIESLKGNSVEITNEIVELWEEYEAQSTMESQWVKVVDRLLPFMMNLNTQGRTWKEQGVSRSQVLAVNKVISVMAPEIYIWVEGKVDYAVQKGWLVNS